MFVFEVFEATILILDIKELKPILTFFGIKINFLIMFYKNKVLNIVNKKYSK